MECQGHGLFIEPVVQPRLVGHGPFALFLQIFHVFSPPLCMVGKEQWIRQAELMRTQLKSAWEIIIKMLTLYSLVNSTKRDALMFLA